MGGRSDFDVICSDDATVAVARVVGDVDLSVRRQLLAALSRVSDSQQLAVDMSGTTFIDSAGLHALVMVWRCRAEAGLTTELRNPSPAVTRVLDIIGLAETFGVDRTTAAAAEPDEQGG